MDYDDNDFQSQNFQLDGEENPKFPPGLRSDALPKFDLDDSLQIHLRFDSLVETGVLLGIQSQEENQWIGEFSRGSSGIEFSSSAAESCPISRCNNVWSEATSSESVEMLLNSVGQDEMITGQAIIEELDACDELGSITNQMELSLNQDGSTLSKIGGVVDAGPALPPDKCLESLSGLNKDVGVEPPEVETTLQTDEGKKSGHGNSRDLDLSSNSEKCGLTVIEGNLISDEKCNDTNRRECGPLADGSLDNRTQGDSTASEIQVTEQNVLASVGELNNQKAPQQVTDISYKNADGLQKDEDETGAEHQVLSKEVEMDDPNCGGNAVETSINNVENPFSLAPKAGSTIQGAEGNALETSTNNVESLSSLASKADSTVQIAEECSEDVCLDSPVRVNKSQVVVMSKDDEMGDLFIENTHEALAVVEGGNKSEGHAVEVSNSDAGTRSILELKMDSLVNITHEQSKVLSFEKQEYLLESDGQELESAISVSNSETSLLTVDDNKLFEGQCDRSNNSHVENLSISTLEMSSSANILRETQATESIKDGHDCLGVHVEDFNAEDHISSSARAEPTHTCESNAIIGLSDIHNSHPDVPVLEKANAGLTPGSGNMNCEIDGCLIGEKRVTSSSLGQSTVKREVIAHEPPPDQIVGDNPATISGVLEDINLVSRDKSNGVHHLLAVNDVAKDKVIEHEDGNLPLHAGDLTCSNKTEEALTKISTEPSLLVLKECSQMESEPVPISESNQGAFHENARPLLCEPVGLSSFSVESVSTTFQNEPQAARDNKATQEYSKELEVCLVLHDSTTGENDGAEEVGVSHEKHEEASLKVEGTMSGNGETLTLTVPSSLKESSCDSGRKGQEKNKASLVSGDNNGEKIVLASTGGDALNSCEGFFRPASLSECNAESHALEAGSRSPNSEEPNCGSPTVISCSDLSQSEKENREGGNAPAFNDVDEIANKVGSISQDPKGNGVSEDDRSFTFEVSSLADLSERENGKGWKPFPIIQPYKFPQIVGDSPSTTSGLCQMDPKILQQNSRGSPRVSDGENVRGSSKGTPKKTRRVSGKTTERETAKAGKPIKEIISVRQTTERGGKSCNVSPSSLGTTSQVVQAEKMGPYEYVEGSSTKPCVVPTIQTSNLPDLNTSASPSALFQQPFTDLQQVQLRAQIFVYGSLIQGTAPDEACMISAFGESDGGRSAWENVWRVAVEKLHNQKSPLSILETPPHLRSGSRVSEQTIRQSALQSKGLPTPVDRAGSTPSAIINPAISLSSPLWNISTPHDGLQFSSIPRGLLLDSHQALSPLHPYQSPHIRNYIGHNTPWLSQAPCSGPWVVSPQTSAVDTGAHYSALPITETVHVTSVRESPVPRPSSLQHVPPSPLVQNGGGAMSVFAGTAPLLDAKKATVLTGKHASAEPKPRKRRKSPASEELGQICSLDQTCTEPVSGTGVTSHLSTSRAIITPANSASKTTTGNFIAAVSPTSSTQYQLVGGRDTEQKAIYLEETCSKIEQAKLQAEDAAALAAAAVRHSQGIWSQLDKQKNSGLISDVEAKLASAAVAVAAAASIAKAAAAAAKVASDAALQAKLMADEALVLSRTGNPTQSTETSVSDSVINLGKVTPALILTGKDRTKNSCSIIVAAREVARRRVEAASAATKRAENMDAIVKAAGLAAEAVSQAGTIIAMGDPIPLSVSELIEAGPEGYWKVQEVSSEQLVISNDINREQSNIDGVEGLDASPKHFNEWPSNKKEKQTIYQGKPPPPKEMSRQSVENHMGLINGMLWDSAKCIEKGLTGQKGRKASELAKTIGVVPESETGSRSDFITVQGEEYKEHQPVGTSNENSIREGSHVEVLSDKDGLRRVWFSAKVLSLKDGKANVCYTDEGSRQLKEWVALEGEGDKEPKIRIARLMTPMKFEGTRKRCREAMGNYAWSVEDRVDAWIRDGWWEGIITEKNKEDETILTVHFPAQGDTSIVRAWHLRPSFIWKDGQWMEWSSPRENVYFPHEGDTPQEKRLKLGSHGADIDPVVVTRGKDNMSKNIGIGESGKPEELRSLALAAKEKIFNGGKSIREENKPDTLRTRRTGLQKEGSRVIFGVPKPGKKRKFMEVSKHYVADRSDKINEVNDSTKFSKYLIPQGSGSRGWKNTFKIDSKEKGTAESKPKVLKSVKTRSVPSRSIPQKDSSLTCVIPASNDGTVQDHLPYVEASVDHDENTSEKQHLIEVGSFPKTRKTAEGPLLFSSLALPSDALKKQSSSAVESDRVNKGKPAPSGEKLARIEEMDTIQTDYSGKSIPDVVEPRRSNRRMQPTSRLLEGLQSSLIISKIPAVSHDKGTKAQHRSASSSRGNNHT